MKVIKTIAILVILIGLPLSSWYFLKGGLDWRKGKVMELTEKGRFLHVYNFDNADKDQLFELMAHKTCVVKFKGDFTDLDKSLMDQFKNAYTFQYLLLSKTVEQPKGWSSKNIERYYKPNNLTTDNKNYKDIDYLIVDTSGFVRQIYSGTSNAVLSSMIEDLAIILPRKKEKEISLKKTKLD